MTRWEADTLAMTSAQTFFQSVGLFLNVQAYF